MNRAKDKFYNDIRIAWWIGFGYVFGWAGYKIHIEDSDHLSAYLDGLGPGLLFFLILVFLHAIVYAILSLWESRNEN